MLLLLIAVAGAALWGVFTGGIVELARRPPRLLWLLGFAGALGAWAVRGGGVQLWIASSLVLLLFAVANVHRFGMQLVVLGAFSNLVVVAINGAMPVSESAAVAIGGDPSTIASNGVHEPIGNETRAAWLGDVIAAPIGGQVVSIGDVLLALGALVFVITTQGTRSDVANEDVDVGVVEDTGRLSWD